MCLRDFPSFIRTTDPNDVALAFTLCTMECHRTVPSTIIFHTFEGLETKVLSAMSGTLRPPVYAIGPLPPLLREEEEDTLVGSNLTTLAWTGLTVLDT
jgi:hypothetical protein